MARCCARKARAGVMPEAVPSSTVATCLAPRVAASCKAWCMAASSTCGVSRSKSPSPVSNTAGCPERAGGMQNTCPASGVYKPWAIISRTRSTALRARSGPAGTTCRDTPRMIRSARVWVMSPQATCQSTGQSTGDTAGGGPAMGATHSARNRHCAARGSECQRAATGSGVTAELPSVSDASVGCGRSVRGGPSCPWRKKSIATAATCGSEGSRP